MNLKLYKDLLTDEFTDKPVDFLSNLNSYITVKDGTTLKNLFNVIYPHRKILSILTNCNLNEFINEALIKTKNESNIVLLKCSWDVCISDDNVLYENVICSGFDENNNLTSLLFTPMNQLIDKLILVDETYVINDKNLKKSITLMQLVQSVIREMCFFANPKKRDKEFIKLRDICNRIDSGEEKLYSWGEIKFSS